MKTKLWSRSLISNYVGCKFFQLFHWHSLQMHYFLLYTLKIVNTLNKINHLEWSCRLETDITLSRKHTNNEINGLLTFTHLHCVLRAHPEVPWSPFLKLNSIQRMGRIFQLLLLSNVCDLNGNNYVWLIKKNDFSICPTTDLKLTVAVGSSMHISYSMTADV